LDTEGYKKMAEKTQSEQERMLVKRDFVPNRNNVRCSGNKSRCPRGFVLVTSDRLSESIDLHNTCEIMIHFDLELVTASHDSKIWEAWRLEKPKRKPKPPAVFHMIQPGSVDEEIFWRLQKRWESLKKLQLGLELVDLTHALGETNILKIKQRGRHCVEENE